MGLLMIVILSWQIKSLPTDRLSSWKTQSHSSLSLPIIRRRLTALIGRGLLVLNHSPPWSWDFTQSLQQLLSSSSRSQDWRRDIPTGSHKYDMFAWGSSSDWTNKNSRKAILVLRGHLVPNQKISLTKACVSAIPLSWMKVEISVVAVLV